MNEILQIPGSLPHFVIAAAACVIGGLMRGFSGFGGGLVLTPLFSLLYGPVLAVPVSVLIDAFPSGKTVSAAGARLRGRSRYGAAKARQSETLRDGRFCAITGAKPLDRIAGYARRVFA